MLVSDAQQEFVTLARRDPPAKYNYSHFRPTHALAHARRTIETRGILPGEPAPNFELPTAEGVPVRLSDLRGRPVLLTFSSFT
ncbi:MAG TPA: redoxin domain-containing protein [Anaerolineaceae bacterium]|nr:redoxin domain-containing protein [Anaerolineaceae bacterium]